MGKDSVLFKGVSNRTVHGQPETVYKPASETSDDAIPRRQRPSCICCCGNHLTPCVYALPALPASPVLVACVTYAMTSIKETDPDPKPSLSSSFLPLTTNPHPPLSEAPVTRWATQIAGLRLLGCCFVLFSEEGCKDERVDLRSMEIQHCTKLPNN